MKRFFTDRVKTSLTIDCNHATDVSLVSKYSCIYQPTFTAYSLSKKPLHPFPEVCQILHKSKNTENVSATIKNSCHTCGRLSHNGENSNESCGRLSHNGESSNESCGSFSPNSKRRSYLRRICKRAKPTEQYNLVLAQRKGRNAKEDGDAETKTIS